jgi:hypothetical protein
MSDCRRQTFIDAPVTQVWPLLGDPGRYPEWWPRVVEVHGDRFEQGTEYVQVTRGPIGSQATKMTLDRLDDLREIRMRCLETGTYAHWLVTEARGGTFVDLALGMDPVDLASRAFDATLGRPYFRRWAEKSLAALRETAVGRGSEAA